MTTGAVHVTVRQLFFTGSAQIGHFDREMQGLTGQRMPGGPGHDHGIVHCRLEDAKPMGGLKE